MAGTTIYVPRLNDSRWDFNIMAGIWHQTMSAGDGANIAFDFSQCDFLRPNAVAFLGGLSRVVISRGGSTQLLVPTMCNAVQMNLLQNGFAHAMGADTPPWQGNSIPYREYMEPDEDTVIQYLRNDWLGRGWINVSDALTREITGKMWEIFANAFEHGNSPVGVYCCGQHFQRQKELVLAVADFGVGIPSNVRIFENQPRMEAHEAMRWAFTLGKSTSDREGPRGVGLDLLKEFIAITHGSLAIFSHDGYAHIDETGETYENLPVFFEGTLVQVTLRCDDSYYCLSNEVSTAPYF